MEGEERDRRRVKIKACMIRWRSGCTQINSVRGGREIEEIERRKRRKRSKKKQFRPAQVNKMCPFPRLARTEPRAGSRGAHIAHGCRVVVVACRAVGKRYRQTAKASLARARGATCRWGGTIRIDSTVREVADDEGRGGKKRTSGQDATGDSVREGSTRGINGLRSAKGKQRAKSASI